MKFALLNGERIEATKGAKGVCPSCGSELIAKCGEIVIHHWAHKKKCDDHWWENETEWHRNWKNQFPKEWQEVIHYDDSGEKHIADVKTNDGWVIEFQHSAINPEERRSRNNFYNKNSKLIWVIDCKRRKTDVKQFKNDLEYGSSGTNSPSILEIYADSRLLKEWKDSNCFVFLDFDDIAINGADFWCICPLAFDRTAYVTRIPRSNFVDYLNHNIFDKMFSQNIKKSLSNIESLEAEKKAAAARREIVNPIDALNKINRYRR